MPLVDAWRRDLRRLSDREKALQTQLRAEYARTTETVWEYLRTQADVQWTSDELMGRYRSPVAVKTPPGGRTRGAWFPEGTVDAIPKMPITMGADFLLYGPIKRAPEIYTACGLADAYVAYLMRQQYRIKPMTKEHPLFKIF